ncbi:hypothetical protein BpHYR1_030806 [Brachionus plicatilis]|uniref:VWFA domain-containing protein n=1 Tax=Brachionus plicatilis TaxID=10195 RepID=A0A3M7PAL6_BRAPC|nr:hypothetical protein BpHYR1_030806 [Brachionus plicatilis]
MKIIFLLLLLTVSSKSQVKQSSHRLDLYLLIDTSDHVLRNQFDMFKLQVYNLIVMLDPRVVRLAIMTTDKNTAILKRLQDDYSNTEQFGLYILSNLKQSKDSSVHNGLQVLQKMLSSDEQRSSRPKISFVIAKNFAADFFRKMVNKIRQESYLYSVEIEQVNASKMFDTIRGMTSNSSFFLGVNQMATVQLNRNEIQIFRTNVRLRKDKKIRIVFKVTSGGFLIKHDFIEQETYSLEHQKTEVIKKLKILCVKSNSGLGRLNEYFKLKGIFKWNSLTIDVSEKISCEKF